MAKTSWRCCFAAVSGVPIRGNLPLLVDPSRASICLVGIAVGIMLRPREKFCACFLSSYSMPRLFIINLAMNSDLPAAIAPIDARHAGLLSVALSMLKPLAPLSFAPSYCRGL